MKKRTQAIHILIIALTFHVFWVNSKLLLKLNFDMLEITIEDISVKLFIAMLFAVSYSLGTITIIRLARTNSKLVHIYATLDAIGVLLCYIIEMPDFIRAVYFAVYTWILIWSTQFIDNPDYLADQIMELKHQGMTQRDIAKKLNLSESKVSRTISDAKERAA